MIATVRISLKAAKALLELVDGGQGIYGVPHEQAEQELKQALAKATRASSTRRELAKPREAKRKTKREATKDVRAEVLKRAGGFCEACGAPGTDLAPLEMDHFFSRRNSESVGSCWMLCRQHHREKTDNAPSATYWLCLFFQHATTRGYWVEAKQAERRMAFLDARGTP